MHFHFMQLDSNPSPARRPANALTNKQLRRRDRNGIACTELAICLPVLLTFLLGCYEASRAYMIQHAAESAAYEAARAGIIPNADPAKCRQIAEHVLRSVGVHTFSLNLEPLLLQPQARSIIVTIEVPMRDNIAFGSFFFRTTTLRGKCEMQRETF